MSKADEEEKYGEESPLKSSMMDSMQNSPDINMIDRTNL